MTAFEKVNRFITSLVEEDESNRRDSDKWIQLGILLGMAVAMHPFTYAKTLIQLGYEPLPPTLERTWLGKEILFLPNLFQYTAHIRKVDGFWGCYRGLCPELYGLTAHKLMNWYFIYNRGFQSGITALGDADSFDQFQTELKDQIVLCAAETIVIHPFNLISVRMMAEFVGHDNIYTNMITSIKEIFQTEGIFGFFNGLAPHLIWELSFLILTASTMYLVNKYILKDKLKEQFSNAIIKYIYANMLYPLVVARICMSVCGSRLAAGQPPIMPLYKNWIECITDLSRRGDLKRGSKLFFRHTSLEASSRNQNLLLSPNPSSKVKST